MLHRYASKTSPVGDSPAGLDCWLVVAPIPKQGDPVEHRVSSAVDRFLEELAPAEPMSVVDWFPMETCPSRMLVIHGSSSPGRGATQPKALLAINFFTGSYAGS